jgi:hypothetical protein
MKSPFSFSFFLFAGLILAPMAWSEVFEGRSSPKPTKSAAIRDAENDLGARISRSIAMQMAVRSERIRSAVGKSGSNSSQYSFQDTVQSKSLVSWTGFNPKVVALDSSTEGGKKMYEARVEAQFDRVKFIQEKLAKVAQLRSQWAKLSSKNLALFMDALPAFYEEYEQSAAESQPQETKEEWNALRASIDSTFSVQLTSIQVAFAPTPGFDPCGQQKSIGILTTTSKGVVVKPVWLDLNFTPSTYRTESEGTGIRVIYDGRCTLVDSVKVSTQIRGLSQTMDERWVQTGVRTTNLDLRGPLGYTEKEILERIGSFLIQSAGLTPVAEQGTFTLSMEPQTKCAADTQQGMHVCKIKVPIKLIGSNKETIWSQSLDARGYGETPDAAREDALRALDQSR